MLAMPVFVGLNVLMNMSDHLRPMRPFVNAVAASKNTFVTPWRVTCWTVELGSLHPFTPAHDFAISVASSPTASFPSSGTSVPYRAVTDQVPPWVSSRLRSLQRGHSSPSSRTSSRQSSTRYALGSSTMPSTLTSVTSAPGDGSSTSSNCVHEQLSPHPPHVMLNHLPPTRAGCGQGHVMPPTSYHPRWGIQGHAGKHSRRHGRSFIEQRPNLLFVRRQRASVAAMTAESMTSCGVSSGKSAHSYGQGSQGVTVGAAIVRL